MHLHHWTYSRYLRNLYHFTFNMRIVYFNMRIMDFKWNSVLQYGIVDFNMRRKK